MRLEMLKESAMPERSPLPSPAPEPMGSQPAPANQPTPLYGAGTGRRVTVRDLAAAKERASAGPCSPPTTP
jgi:hypothetical protein